MSTPASRPEHVHDNLLGGPPPTYLPDDHPDVEVARALEAGRGARELAAGRPSSSLAWAVLAEEALDAGSDVEAYAYARTGYHRGLDALRRAGWRGHGPVPASHAPNTGFLRALAALGEAARRIGEDDEAQRIATFLTDCDPTFRS
ncbi:MAG: DUF3151 domain-containing protein [Actinomycetes bacterium]